MNSYFQSFALRLMMTKLKQKTAKHLDPFFLWLAKRLDRYLIAARYEVILRGLKKHGEHIFFHGPIAVSGAEQVEFGDYVSIGPFVSIWGEGGIQIGNRVMIGAHTALTSLGHVTAK